MPASFGPHRHRGCDAARSARRHGDPRGPGHARQVLDHAAGARARPPPPTPAGASVSQRITSGGEAGHVGGPARPGRGRSGRRPRGCGRAAGRCGGRSVARTDPRRRCRAPPAAAAEQGVQHVAGRVVSLESSRTSSSSRRSGRRRRRRARRGPGASAPRTSAGPGVRSRPVTSGRSTARAAGPCSRRRSTYAATCAAASGRSSRYLPYEGGDAAGERGRGDVGEGAQHLAAPAPGRAAGRGRRRGPAPGGWRGRRPARSRAAAGRPSRSGQRLRAGAGPGSAGPGRGGRGRRRAGCRRRGGPAGRARRSAAARGRPRSRTCGAARSPYASGRDPARRALVVRPAVDGPAHRRGLLLGEYGEQLVGAPVRAVDQRLGQVVQGAAAGGCAAGPARRWPRSASGVAAQRAFVGRTSG